MRHYIPLFFLICFLSSSCTKTFSPSNDIIQDPYCTPNKSGNNRYSEVFSIASEALKRFYPETKGGTDTKNIRNVIPYVNRTRSADADTLFYIVNYGNNDGFCLVSAKKSVEPILAITENGYYDGGETGNAGFDIYISGLVAELSSIGDGGIIVQPDIVDTIRFTELTVGPLLETTWHQVDPYNYYCPTIRDEYLILHYCKVGCGAVALSQIAAYYEHPSSLNLTFSGAPVQTLYPDWDEMKEYSPNEGYSSRGLMIAQFMREVGKSLYTSYGLNSSPTAPDLIPGGLSAISFSGSSSSYNLTNIVNALSVNRPVLIYAFYSNSPTQGHIWVIDGFQLFDYSYDYYIQRGFNWDGSPWLEYSSHYETTTHYLHFNMGESDQSLNGYYLARHYLNTSGDLFPDTEMVSVTIFAEIPNQVPNTEIGVYTNITTN